MAGMNAEAQAKLAEIQKELGGRELTRENMQQLEMQKQQMEAQKDELMNRICTPEAVERLRRVGVVKTQLSKQVRDKLLQMAQSGQINSKVTEDQLIKMLEKEGESNANQKITIQRRKSLDSDDEEDDSDLM